MLKWIKLCSLVLASGWVVGCDWTSGGGVDGYNSRYNWADFSGVYRGINGGILVTDYSTAVGTPGSPGVPGSTNRVVNEVVGTADGSRTVFSGTLRRSQIIPGSVGISTAGFQLTDDGIGGLSGSGRTGSIDYGTGAWSIDLIDTAPDAGTPIRASYQYSVSGSPGSEPGDPSVSPGRPGSTRFTIFSFTIFQQGENIVIMDNNGAEYRGKLGNTRITEGVVTDLGTPSVGTTVIAQYSTEGVSKAGINVRMVGTLQGVVQGSSGNQLALADRRMFGTWIERGGRTGDINGQASPVTITVIQETPQVVPQ